MGTTQTKILSFYEAAYLILKQIPLAGHYREKGATVFVFENSDLLNQYIEEFNNLRGYVDALSYSAVLRNLKTIIHSGRSTQSTSQRGESYNESNTNNSR